MARKFPLTLSEGSVSVTIYRDPLHAPVTPTGKPGRPAQTRRYDSYLVSYYLHGKRQRQRFKSYKLAAAKAQEVLAKMQRGDVAALELTGNHRAQHLAALEFLAGTGVPLDLAAKEYVDARKLLSGGSLVEAARFFVRFGQTLQLKATVPDLVAQLVADLKADQKSEYHIKSTQQRLTAFAGAFPGQIIEIKTGQIDKWLRELKGKSKSGQVVDLAGKTRNHYRNSVVHLFNYAQTKGCLPKGMPTEAEGTSLVAEEHSPNEIFSVEEMTRLLDNAPPHLIAPMAIKAFSGVRTEEVTYMDWQHIDFEKGYIILPREVTKTNRRRLIPLTPNLRKWLEPVRVQQGRVCARWSRPQAVFQAFDRYGRRQGIDVGANKFRNSYISYRVAETKNVAQVSLESGNSPGIIQTEYLELTTSEEAKRWFAIEPTIRPRAPQPKRPVKRA